VSDFPNIPQPGQIDPDKLTVRQIQIHMIRQDYEAKHPISPSREKTDRMAAAVPALLAHIDELYGDINDLKAKCGKQADMLARHCRRRDDIERMANSLDPTSGVDRINTFKSDLLQILGGVR